MPWASAEKRREYQREYQRKWHADPANRAKIREWRRKQRAANREEYNAKQREWRAENLEHARELARKLYARHREEILARRRELHAARRDEINARKRERYALKKKEREESKNMAKELELERCPLCGAAGAVKVGGRGYAWGCSNRKCAASVWKRTAEETVHSAAAAAATWNSWAEEHAEGEARQDAAPPIAGEPPAPPEEEVAGKGEAAAEGVRYWTEVDGAFYWLEEGADGCEGCAFRSGFGKRTFCGAEAVDGLGEAATLCQARNGVWRVQEEG